MESAIYTIPSRKVYKTVLGRCFYWLGSSCSFVGSIFYLLPPSRPPGKPSSRAVISHHLPPSCPCLTIKSAGIRWIRAPRSGSSPVDRAQRSGLFRVPLPLMVCFWFPEVYGVFETFSLVLDWAVRLDQYRFCRFRSRYLFVLMIYECFITRYVCFIT